MAEGCPLIEKLDLRECYEISDVSIKAIANGCTLLVSLDLSDCSENITNLSIKHLALQCPLLQDIFLVGCHRITDLSATALAYNCRHLETVDLDCNENATNKSSNLHRDAHSLNM